MIDVVQYKISISKNSFSYFLSNAIYYFFTCS